MKKFDFGIIGKNYVVYKGKVGKLLCFFAC